ncbi:EF-hand domain-containing protein [Ekhidna sp.]|uniref:EF-hand domain-containing protein n=1 Tax=Ekhidna sp. TaxID=2608089 RepID=UPI003B509887
MQVTDTIRKWILFFYLMDTNKDGVLEPSDFDELLERLYSTRKGLFNETEKNYLKYITVKNFDRLLMESDGKGRKITVHEWVRIIQRSNESEEKSYFIRWFSASVVRFLFDLCDHNKDGFIDFDEFETLYRILGLKRGTIIFAFKELDINRDGRLSKSEMYDAINEYFSSSNATINNHIFGQLENINDEYFSKLIIG